MWLTVCRTLIVRYNLSLFGLLLRQFSEFCGIFCRCLHLCSSMSHTKYCKFKLNSTTFWRNFTNFNYLLAELLIYSFIKLMNRLPYATDRNCTSNGSLAESSCILWLPQKDILMGFFVSYSSVLMQSCWTKFRTYSNLHHFLNCRKFSPDI